MSRKAWSWRGGRVVQIAAVAALVLGCGIVAEPAAEAVPAVTVKVFLDLDHNPSTGCSIATTLGTFDGAEQVVTTTVLPGAGTVVSVSRQVCTAGSLGAPIVVNAPFAPPWSAGAGNGSDGSFLIETYLPAAAVSTAAPAIRAGFATTDALGNEDALFPTATIQLQGSGEAIPTLSEWGLLLLAASLAVIGAALLRRHRTGVVAVLALAALLTGLLGTAWAAITLDGQASDWAGIPPLATKTPGANPTLAEILAVYGAGDGGNLFFRIDTKICPEISVSPSSLASGTAGTAFPTTTFTATGAAGAVTWSVASGSLPAGLTLDPSTGVLAGTPLQTASSSPLTILATDANGCTGSRALAITIACPTVTVTPPAGALPAGATGSAYSQSFAQAGGIGTVTWSVASGALPGGLTLDPSTGALSGTPTQTVTSAPFSVRATDANGCHGETAYTLTVGCGTVTVAPAAGALPGGIAGAPYVGQTFGATGANGAIAWSVAAGALPSGLTLNPSTGVLSGTPTQTATSAPLTIRATDANGCHGETAYTLTVACGGISVAPPAGSLPSGVAGAPYAGQTFTASGGVGSVVWSVAAGTLPNGLTLDPSTGVLSGTPTQTATNAPITVRATDANGCGGETSYTLTVACPAITVAPGFLPAGVQGSAYAGVTFTQTGSSASPIAWSVSSGTLPPGVSLDPGTGALSGTPGAAGTFPVTVTATDANGCSGSHDYLLTVGCPGVALTVAPAALPPTTAGTAASPTTFTASGGTGPYTFTLAGALPSGMTFSGATLSGTPTQTGVFPLTVAAVDGSGCGGSRDYLLTVACSGTAITVSPATLPSVVAGAAFPSTAFTAAGGTGPYAFELAGALPAGLSFSGDTLSGTPTEGGSFPVTVAALDASGCGGSRDYTLTVTCPTITVLPAAGALPPGTAGSAYPGQMFTSSGGTGTVTWSVSSGTLPTGLTLNSSTGSLSGTPTQTATGAPITIRATDANGCHGETAYTLTINCQAITVAPAAGPLPAGVAGTPYAGQTFTQTGGIGTITWSVSSGTLPAGLTLNSATGALSGTPTQTVTDTPITVRATDANGCHGETAYTLTVSCPSITVNPASLGDGTYNAAYPLTFTAAPSGPAYTFHVTAGALPAGMTLLASGAVTPDTPTATGSFAFTVTATDPATGCTGARAYSLTVRPTATAKAFGDGVGNTQLMVAGYTPAPTTPVVSESVNLLAGATGVGPFTAALASGPSHGAVAVNGDGTFLYTPSVGYTGLDSFTYTVTDSSSTASLPATVGVTLTDVVWYVDNTFGGTSDGRSHQPFTTLNAASSPTSSAGHFIYVHTGSGNTQGAVTLIASQTLWGQGAAFTLHGLSIPAGAKPTLAATVTLGGNGVTVSSLDIDSGSNTGLTNNGSAATGATVENGVTVTSTTATAVAISNLTASSLTFGAISAGTLAGGPASGITISNFGGAFSVLGDGSDTANGSGGTIQKTTGNAVSLAGITGSGLSLASMVIKSSTHDGVHGSGVNNVTLLGCQVLNNGTTASDNGVHLLDVSGAATFTDDTVTGSYENDVWIDATPGSTAAMTSLSVTNGSYSSSGNDTGFLVSLRHTAAIGTATFTNATFSGNYASGLQLQVNDGATIGNGAGAPSTGTATVTGCTFTNNGNTAADFDQGGGGGVSFMYARFVNNTTITGNAGPAVNVFSSASSGGGTLKARIEGNHVGAAAIAGSGTTAGPGIRVLLQGKTVGTVAILNNVVRQTPGSRGIDVEALGPTLTGQPITISDVTVTGNDVNNDDTSGFALDDIYVAADNQGSPAQVRAEIHGNTIKSGSGCADYPSFSGTDPWLYYNIATVGAVAQLVGFGGQANAVAELTATNTGTTGAGAGVTLIAGPINSVP